MLSTRSIRRKGARCGRKRRTCSMFMRYFSFVLSIRVFLGGRALARLLDEAIELGLHAEMLAERPLRVAHVSLSGRNVLGDQGARADARAVPDVHLVGDAHQTSHVSESSDVRGTRD